VVCMRFNKGAYALINALLLLVLGACGAQVNQLDPALLEKAEGAREVSLTWLSEAITASNDLSERSSLQRIKGILEERAILAAPSDYKEICDQHGTAAFVIDDLSSSYIYLCEGVGETSKSALAQILIHEATHIHGERDECNTTRWELKIMDLAARIPHKNAYVDECGL